MPHMLVCGFCCYYVRTHAMCAPCHRDPPCLFDLLGDTQHLILKFTRQQQQSLFALTLAQK